MISPSRIREAGYTAETPLAIGIRTSSGERRFITQGGFDAETVAYGASLAKQFTGACAALLARRGGLDPEAPIAEWLPELPGWRDDVRVRHLIHHTAGLSDVQPAAWTSAAVLAALAETPALVAEPGTAYAYSNVGYICLAAVVERIAGLPFSDFARMEIFEPLGMEHSRFWTGPAPAPPDAAEAPGDPPPLSAGDGGLWTTVNDLLRWNDAIFDDALGVSATIHTPGALDDGTPLEYAWGVRVFRSGGHVVHSHGGDYGRATGKLIRMPGRSTGFAALAADGSVERMVALGDLLLDEL